MPPERLFMEFILENHQKVGKFTLFPSRSPRTYILLWQQLRKPVRTRFILRKKEGEISIPFKIGRVGPEKSTRHVERGDIAYWPQSQLLILFLKSKQTFNPVNIVGKIENLSFFDNLVRSDRVKLQSVSPPIDDKYYL